MVGVCSSQEMNRVGKFLQIQIVEMLPQSESQKCMDKFFLLVLKLHLDYIFLDLIV